jgi:hypothetical protein
MGSIDRGIHKKFAEKKSSLTFNVINILNSQRAVFFVYVPEQNLVVKTTIFFVIHQLHFPSPKIWNINPVNLMPE